MPVSLSEFSGSSVTEAESLTRGVFWDFVWSWCDGGLWPGIFVLRIPSQICGWREIKFHIFWDQRQLLLTLVWNYLLCSVAQLFLTLCDPMDCSLPNLSVHGQEFWSRLPFPSPEYLPDPRIEPTSLVSCIGRWFFTTSAIWEALCLSVVTV